MRAKTFTVAASAGGPSHSPAWIVDTWSNPISIGIGVVVSGPLAIADVQHTFADPFEINLNAAASANAWTNNATLVSATAALQNGSVDTNYAFAPRAIRLRMRATASADAATNRATITILQAGPD